MIEPTTLARPYARAAFEFARAHGQLDHWHEQLAVLAAIGRDPRVAAMLGDPARTGRERAETLLGLLEQPATSELRNFVLVMADNGRLNLFPEVLGLFVDLKSELESTISVEVASAYELSADELQQLATALGTRLERTISITSHTDPSLVGGALIRAGDLVIDGSVRGRLEKLAGALTP